MSIELVVALIVALLSFAGAIITAAISYYSAKHSQLELDKHKWKVSMYNEYIKSITLAVQPGEQERGSIAYASAHNQVMLIASPDMAKAALDLFVFIRDNTAQKKTFIASLESKPPELTQADKIKISTFLKNENDKSDELVTAIYRAMREDLFGKEANSGYPDVQLASAPERQTTFVT